MSARNLQLPEVTAATDNEKDGKKKIERPDGMVGFFWDTIRCVSESHVDLLQTNSRVFSYCPALAYSAHGIQYRYSRKAKGQLSILLETKYQKWLFI